MGAIRVLVVDGAQIPDAWRGDARFELTAFSALAEAARVDGDFDLVLVADDTPDDVMRRVRRLGPAVIRATDGHDPDARIRELGVARFAAEIPPGVRVLLIDDEALLLKAYRRMLAGACEVVTAEGGAQALEVLKSDSSFDVVICDLMMPEVDGLMVYQEMGRSVADLRERLVFCSGGVFSARASSLLASMDNALIEKPIRTAGLKDAIARVVDRRVKLAS